MRKKVSIITDPDGKKIALINDVKFKSRRMLNWTTVGWYRYDTRLGLPVYSEEGILTRYNIFTVRMLVRCDKDGKLYLYDFVRTKKETSKPHE